MRRSSRVFLDVVLPAIAVLLIASELYTGLFGPSGWRANRYLKAELAAREADLALVVARREALARRADQLNPRSLDPDMIDERIRAVLGYVSEGDIVIPADEFEALVKELSAGKPPAR